MMSVGGLGPRTEGVSPFAVGWEACSVALFRCALRGNGRWVGPEGAPGSPGLPEK
jgi:hypothetical protein